MDYLAELPSNFTLVLLSVTGFKFMVMPWYNSKICELSLANKKFYETAVKKKQNFETNYSKAKQVIKSNDL